MTALSPRAPSTSGSERTVVVVAGRWPLHPVHPAGRESINQFTANRVITSTSEQLLEQRRPKQTQPSALRTRSSQRQLRLLSGFQVPHLPPQWSSWPLEGRRLHRTNPKLQWAAGMVQQRGWELLWSNFGLVP